MTNKGNRTSGREDLDKPFKARRRNLGQKNADGVTRADAVALALSKADTLRELCHIAIALGVPPRYVDAVLARNYRNSVMVMTLHRAARHFHKKQEKVAVEKKHVTFATRRCGRTTRIAVTGRTSASTQTTGLPPVAKTRRRD